ncbi:MAG: ABC transporter ATP-binding protein, partial [Dehalococcoidia bacterium]
TKGYGEHRGIFDLDLEVQQGEVFGFLGPNGAGKSTTIRLLLDLIRPDRGRAWLLGLDSRRDSTIVHRQIGYLPGELALDSRLSGRQLLTYFANLRGGVDWREVAALAGRLDLDLDRRFGEYSRGNKQKVGLIQSFMHRPRLLILDEPTGGLDPLNQEAVFELVREVRAEGRSVFFSSHILSEVEALCERIAFIRAGRLIRVAPVHELTGIRTYEVEATCAVPLPADLLQRLPSVSGVQIDGAVVRCSIQGDMSPLISVLTPYHVQRLLSHEPSLSEVFLGLYEGDQATDSALNDATTSRA